jgi:hypothetical protein
LLETRVLVGRGSYTEGCTRKAGNMTASLSGEVRRLEGIGKEMAKEDVIKTQLGFWNF